MRDEDIKQLIERCRTLAGKADIFTQKRLHDLALRYEAMYEKRPADPKIVPPSVNPQPVSIQSISIQLGKAPDRPRDAD